MKKLNKEIWIHRKTKSEDRKSIQMFTNFRKKPFTLWKKLIKTGGIKVCVSVCVCMYVCVCVSERDREIDRERERKREKEREREKKLKWKAQMFLKAKQLGKNESILILHKKCMLWKKMAKFDENEFETEIQIFHKLT